MREFTLYPVTEVMGSWEFIVKEYKKPFISGIFCEFGLAEEVIGLMIFETGFYAVGVGECCRPYRELYIGTSQEKASEAFYKALTESIEYCIGG